MPAMCTQEPSMPLSMLGSSLGISREIGSKRHNAISVVYFQPKSFTLLLKRDESRFRLLRMDSTGTPSFTSLGSFFSILCDQTRDLILASVEKDHKTEEDFFNKKRRVVGI